MKMILIILMLWTFLNPTAEASYHYGGGHHLASHGGSYHGSTNGSSHRGGHYIGPHGGYGRHR
jgi:hypothetical protein